MVDIQLSMADLNNAIAADTAAQKESIMTHDWKSSDERKQWECLNCGATVSHEVAASAPTAEHMAHAKHPGLADHIVERMREAGEECYAVIPPEWRGHEGTQKTLPA